MTIDNPTSSTNDIYNLVIILFERSWKEEPIRNIGVRLADLTTEKKEQVSIFDVTEKIETNKMEEVMDNINNRFGRDSIKFASTSKSKKE